MKKILRPKDSSGILKKIKNLSVLTESGCIEYVGGKSLKGYGKIRYNNKHYRAHRLIWILANGEIPSGYFICHSCDNPPCINLAHLFLGTPKENTLDAKAKNRLNNQWTKGPR